MGSSVQRGASSNSHRFDDLTVARSSGESLKELEELEELERCDSPGELREIVSRTDRVIARGLNADTESTEVGRSQVARGASDRSPDPILL